MNPTLENLLNHLHSATGHFPIALLIVGVGLDVLARWRPNLQFSAWLLILLGTIGAIAATISGLAAHIAYEDTPAIEQIELHQWLAFATTAIFVVLTAWRWRALRRSDQFRASGLWTAASLVGLVALAITGYVGGHLVFEYGVGVQGVTR